MAAPGFVRRFVRRTIADITPGYTAGDPSTCPACTTLGPILACPTTATGAPGDVSSKSSREEERTLTGTRRLASAGESSTARTATSSAPRDTYTHVASLHDERESPEDPPSSSDPGSLTRIAFTFGPFPSPPAAIADGCTTCALVSINALPCSRPLASPPVLRTTPDAHDAPRSVSIITTDRELSCSGELFCLLVTVLPPPTPPLFLVPSPPPFTRSPSAPRIDAIVSTNGAASAILQRDERVDPT